RIPVGGRHAETWARCGPQRRNNPRHLAAQPNSPPVSTLILLASSPGWSRDANSSSQGTIILPRFWPVTRLREFASSIKSDTAGEFTLVAGGPESGKDRLP